MKKRSVGKRILSVLLALSMVIGALPMTAFAVVPDGTNTNDNVVKIQNYAAQLLDANDDFTDYSSSANTNGRIGLTWDSENKNRTWTYYNGVMLSAFIMMNKVSGLDFAKKFYDKGYNIAETATADGLMSENIENITPESIKSVIKDYPIGELDSVPTAGALIDLLCADASDDSVLTDEQEKRYSAAVWYVYNQLNSYQINLDEEYKENNLNYGGNYKHKNDADSWSYWVIGLDGLYMAQPFLVKLAKAVSDQQTNSKIPVPSGISFNPNDIYSAATERLLWVYDNMRDSKTGLFNHGYSKDGKVNGHFWSRGIGWYAAAMVDVIELLPDGEEKESLKSKLQSIFLGMIQWQDANTGMWTNVVNREEALTHTYTKDNTEYTNKNELEVSGSALMAYAMMKAYNNGWVNDVCGKAGLKAFNGIVENKVETREDTSVGIADQVNGIFRSAGVEVTDEEYLESFYETDEAKGVGPLIMAATLAKTTYANLVKAGVSTTENITESFTASDITVSGSGAEALFAHDKSSDAAIKDIVGKKLTEGYYAYQLDLSNDTNASTITIPIPNSISEENFAVYEVLKDGTLSDSIEGTFSDDGKYYTFKSLKAGTYVWGSKVDLSNVEWITIESNTVTETTYNATTEFHNDNAYIITRDKNGSYSVYWTVEEGGNEPTIVGGTTTVSQIAEVEGQYTVQPYKTSDPINNFTWYYEEDQDGQVGTGYLYTWYNDNKYYLKETSTNEFVLNTNKNDDLTSWSVVVDETNDGAVDFYNVTQKRYMQIASSGLTDKGANPHASTTTYLWSRNDTITVTEYEAVLYGNTEYNVLAGTPVKEVLDMIYNNATVYYREVINEEEQYTEGLEWGDSRFNYYWTLNGTTIEENEIKTYAVGDKYRLVVECNGHSLGSIYVTIEEPKINLNGVDWSLINSTTSEIIGETYSATEIFEDGNAYIITRDKNGSYSVYWTVEEGGNEPTIVGGTTTVSQIAEVEEQYTVQPYKTSDPINNFTWYYEEDQDGQVGTGYLYTWYNDNKYYLKETSTNEFVLNTNKNDDLTSWSVVVDETNDGAVDFYNVTQKRYMQIASSGLTDKGANPHASTTTYLWSRNDTITVTEYEAVLYGNTEYNVLAGTPVDEVLNMVYGNAAVYYREIIDGAVQDVERLRWDDERIRPQWRNAVGTTVSENEISTVTAGDKYQLVVKYNNGISLGSIVVNIVDSYATEEPTETPAPTPEPTVPPQPELNVSWKDIEPFQKADTFTLTRTVKEDSKGYVIMGRDPFVGQNYVLGWQSNDSGISSNSTAKNVYESPDLQYPENKQYFSPGDRYLIDNISENNLWYFEYVETISDESTVDNDTDTIDIWRIYTTDSTGEHKYYIISTGNTNGVAFTEDASGAATFFIKANADFVNTIIYYNDGSNRASLKLNGASHYITTSTNALTLWERTEGKVITGQAALDGTLRYSELPTGISQEDVMGLIKEGAQIYYRESEDANYEEVEWNDSNVSYEWISFDSNSVSSVSVLSVKYGETEIGKITADFGTAGWTKYEAFDLYKLVHEMQEYNEISNPYPYVIADTDGTGLLTLDNSNVTTSTVTETVVAKYIDDLYTIANANKNTYWYLDGKNQIYVKGDSDNYYLSNKNSGNKDDDGSITLNPTGSGYKSTWVFENFSSKETVIRNEETYPIRFRSDNGNARFYIYHTKGANYRVSIYQYTGETTPAGEAKLSGTLTHNIHKDASFTEVDVMKAASVLFHDDSGLSIIDWDNEGLVCTWKDASGKTIDKFIADTVGEYTMTVSYLDKELGDITVNVYDADISGTWSINKISEGENGYSTVLKTGIRREPDLSEIKLTLNYKDSNGTVLDTEEITVHDGLDITYEDSNEDGEPDYDVTKAGTYDATVHYTIAGKTFDEKITIIVDPNPYAELTPAPSPYPAYPKEGAVRINKFASNSEFTFRRTGVTKVELDVAGVSAKNGVDVVLVMDVSNSMGWTEGWEGHLEGTGVTEATAKDIHKIAGVTVPAPTELPSSKTLRQEIIASEPGNRDKLDVAMDTATQFAESLLGTNVPGAANNNSLTFVTFAGNDSNNCTEDQGYVDAVQTVFTNVEDKNIASKVFGETYFTHYYVYDETEKDSLKTSVQYKLQIGQLDADGKTVSSVSGLNRGNTNYDYAFAEATKAVEQVQSKYGNSYESLGRHTVVVFMSDGAPTHYNNEAADGSTNDRIYGTTIEYPAEGDYLKYTNMSYTSKDDDDKYLNNAANWTTWINNPNNYAERLSDSNVEAFYVVGFDLSHGGFSDFSWDQDALEPIMRQMAGSDYDGTQNIDDVKFVEKEDELKAFFSDLANQISKPGTEAEVTDEIGSAFTLQLGQSFNVINGSESENGQPVVGSDNKVIAPNIEVLSYKLYTASDVGKANSNGITITEDMIGSRTGNYTVLETVSFDENGTQAYSDVIDKKNNTTDYGIMTTITEDNVTTITIDAEYFDYTKVYTVGDEENAVETFKWHLGDITENEVALSYYVRLKDAEAIENNPEGNFPTNNYAHLEYIDIDGNYAKQTYRIPYKSWGGVRTTVEFYLVNEAGHPINFAEEVISYWNKQKIEVENSEDLTKYIKWGDDEVDEVRSYTFNVEDLDFYLPGGYKLFNPKDYYTITINANDDSGSVNIVSEDKITEENGIIYPTTRRWDQNGSNVNNTIISVAVVLTGKVPVGAKFGEDKIVVDYGKSIQVDILADNPGVNAPGAKYKASLVGFAEYSKDKYDEYTNYIQTSSGYKTITGSHGNFEVVNITKTNADGSTTENYPVVQYNPTSLMSKVERVFTIIEVLDTENPSLYYYVYQELDVIPATVMYYETDFSENAFTFTQKDSNEANIWSKESDSVEDVFESVQDPGPLSKHNIENGTATITKYNFNKPYGYDSTYEDDSQLSNGTSWKVNGKGVDNTYSSFTFTGTGFDIISRTGADHGIVRVQVFNAESGDLEKSISVLNKAESAWGELYQIPVLSIEMDDYGTYDVNVEVLDGYTDDLFPALSRGNLFYFDAVRIYNPAMTDEIALDAYMNDGEYNPEIYEVRDLLVDDFDADGTDVNEGVVFIEREGADNHKFNFVDYKAIGPNNELYLSENQAVAFKIQVSDVDNIASIDIAAKSVDGKPVKMAATISKDANKTEGAYNTINKSIESSTQQYFDLTEIDDKSNIELSNVIDANSKSAYVFIMNANTGLEDYTGVLSITDIKIAYKEHVNTLETTQFYATPNLLMFARACVSDYDIKSARFSTTQCKVFGNASLVVETTQDVEVLKITNGGLPVSSKISYEDREDGTRMWDVTVLMTVLGEQSYTITGYGDDGSHGESDSASILVTIKEGGGWQDAKSILKTLFNCRILSIKRGTRSRL